MSSEMVIVPAKSVRNRLRQTTKRLEIFANLSKTPEHILSRFGEFAILANKFCSLRWSGEIFFFFTENGAKCTSNELKVVYDDSQEFFSHAEVINAMFKSIASSVKNDFELVVRISAKRR